MDASASGSEPQQAGKRALNVNKACVPCRTRKTRCDADIQGLPCSSCTSRQNADDCVLPVRKRRRRTVDQGETTGLSFVASSSRPKHQSIERQLSDPQDKDRQSPQHVEQDLLYLNLLNDAVKDAPDSSQQSTTSNTSEHAWQEASLTPQNCVWSKLPHLDDADQEYLIKKGVFDLPPRHHLDALIKAYFDHVHPFTPVLNRADFIRSYQSGDCSLFLLRAMLTTAALHAPTDVLSAYGFTSRSVAQESFFSQAKLLHDFAAETNTISLLQGSIILCMVLLDHPTDWDFGYWLHNAVRLTTKLDIRTKLMNARRQDNPSKLFKLYRRIWWALYSLDVFHVFASARRSRLLFDIPAIKSRTEDDWEVEDFSGTSFGLLSEVTPQQKALPVVLCELSQLFGQCATKHPPRDARQIMHSLDVWRKSLATKMHVAGSTGTDLYYLNLQAMSYRYECIWCRQTGRYWQRNNRPDGSEWAKQRLRAAILELDTIAMRVLANGTFEDFPMSFVTTVAALLALHIESALDPNETDLIRSMARISISQTMLLLNQGKEIPAVKRALPIFEGFLAKKDLLPGPPSGQGRIPPPTQSQDEGTADAYASPPGDVAVSQLEPFDDHSVFDVDFLGFDFLKEWHIEDMSFTDVR